MGLFIITGTMGGGKSFYAVELARNCWRSGGIVHSNLPFVNEELERNGWLDRHVVLPKDTTLWAKKTVQEDGSEILTSDYVVGGQEGAENLVIIDEAALSFHAYDQVESRKKNRAMFEFVVMSRQIGIDIYFISQSATNIDAAIRKVAENIIKCVNVSRIPGVGPLIAPFVGQFRRLWLTVDKGVVQSACFARFKPEVAKLYKTHGEGDKIGIKRDASRKPVKPSLSPMVWLFVIMILGFIGGAVYMLYKTPAALASIGHHDDDAPAAVSPRPAASSAAPSFLGAPPSPPPPPVAPYVVARLLNPLSIFDNRGRVYSVRPGPGVRVFDLMSETDRELVLSLRGQEVVVLEKPE